MRCCAKKVAQQPRLDRHGFRRRARGKTRHHDVDAMLAHRHVEPRRSVIDDGLLDDEDAVQPRAAGQQVLRALKDEIPPQVGQGHDVRMVDESALTLSIRDDADGLVVESP